MLNFGSFICLTFIFFIVLCDLSSVCGDLSKNDIEIISALVQTAIAPVMSKLDIVEKNLKNVEKNLKNVEKNMKNGFIGIHNFGRDRVDAAMKFTQRFDLKQLACDGVETRHAFFYSGFVGEIISPHLNCSGANESMIALRDSLIITHPNMDLGIITECPSKEHVLDIAEFTDPKLGDRVISFGYGDLAKVWDGTVSDVFETPNISYPSHWTKSAERINGEYIVQSAQHGGQSGAAVSNGCGCLGMAHIVVSENFTVFAGIIPAQQIIDFVEYVTREYPGRLKKMEDCSSVNRTGSVVSFPISPFMKCENNNDEKVDIVVEVVF